MKPQTTQAFDITINALPLTGFIRQSQLIGPGNPLPISASTLWKWIADAHFPKPVKLSSRVSAWRVEDVRAFFAARMEEVRR